MDNLTSDARYYGVAGSIRTTEPPQSKRYAATLETLNDDCLCEIADYLNIFDAEKLAATCSRLRSFVECFIYPKHASEIEINFELPSGLQRNDASISMIDYQKPFESFGGFIKKLTFTGPAMFLQSQNWQCFKKIMGLCPNLDTLCITYTMFHTEDYFVFNRDAPLDELKAVCCYVLKSGLSAELLRFLKIEHITYTGLSQIDADFFRGAANFSSLTLDYRSLSTERDLEFIFDQNGQNIRQLKLLNFSELSNFQSIGALILNKVPNVAHLAIEDTLSEELTDLLAELPNLKCLKIMCNNRERINALTRKLSALDTIEELCIENGAFEVGDVDGNADDAPLVFSRLRCVRWRSRDKQDSRTIISTLTKSQMPSITCFNFDLHMSWSLPVGICELFESKNTLKSMKIACVGWNNVQRNWLALKMISILKQNRNRPYLYLKIQDLAIDTQLVSIQ